MNINFKKPLPQTKAFLETSNLESNTLDDDHGDHDAFRSESHDQHLSSSDDSIAYDSQEFDNYEDNCQAYSRKKNPTMH